MSNWSDAWRVHLIFDYLCDDDTDETDENDAAERGAAAAGGAGAALPRVVPAHLWPAPPPPVRLAAGEVLRQTRRSIDRALDAAARARAAPSWIIIGAMKGGTTALYEYLMAHPLCVRGRRRETHFFDWRWPDGAAVAGAATEAEAGGAGGAGAAARPTLSRNAPPPPPSAPACCRAIACRPACRSIACVRRREKA